MVTEFMLSLDVFIHRDHPDLHANHVSSECLNILADARRAGVNDVPR